MLSTLWCPEWPPLAHAAGARRTPAAHGTCYTQLGCSISLSRLTRLMDSSPAEKEMFHASMRTRCDRVRFPTALLGVPGTGASGNVSAKSPPPDDCLRRVPQTTHDALTSDVFAQVLEWSGACLCCECVTQRTLQRVGENIFTLTRSPVVHLTNTHVPRPCPNSLRVSLTVFSVARTPDVHTPTVPTRRRRHPSDLTLVRETQAQGTVSVRSG